MSDERGRHRRAGAQPGLRTAAVQAALDTFAHGRSADLGRPLRVLDLGGGTGGTAVPLAAAGHDVTVVDPSPDALASLARRAAETGTSARIHPVQGDTDTVGEPGADGARPAYDLVCLHGTLEVVDDPDAALANIAAVLAPGGTLSLVVAQRLPAALARALAGQFARAKAILERPDGRWGDDDPAPRRFDEPAVRDLLAAHGLTTVREPRRAHLQRPRALGPGRLRGRPGRPARPRGRREPPPRPPAARRPGQRAARPRDPGLTPAGATDEPSTVRPPDPRLQRAARRHRLHGAARRHGRLLRVRDAARRTPTWSARRSSSAAAAPAGWCSRPPTRRAASASPRRCRWPAPGGCARRPPCCRPTTRSTARVSRGGDGDLPLGHPAHRAALARRGVPRRLRRGAPARAALPASASTIRDTRARRAGHHLLGRRRADQVRRQAGLRAGQARRHGRRAARRGACRSCSSCRSGRCGAWGSAPRRRCTRLGLRTVADIAHTPLRDAACAASATPPAATCTSWPGAATRGRSSASSVEKSIGSDETFDHDVDDPRVVHRELLRAERAHRRPDAGRRA